MAKMAISWSSGKLFTSCYFSVIADCYAWTPKNITWLRLVEHLVGKQFRIDETDYAIVDVRNIQGDTMIYAEPTKTASGPKRAAFRYDDIESKLEINTDDVA